MTNNPLQIPELLQLIISSVDTKSLHSCACVSQLWFRHAATAAQNRLQTNQKVSPSLLLHAFPDLFPHGLVVDEGGDPSICGIQLLNNTS